MKIRFLLIAIVAISLLLLIGCAGEIKPPEPDRIFAQEQMDAVRNFYARSERDTALFWDEIPYTFPILVTGEIPYPGTGGGEATARAYFEEFKGLYRLTNPAQELAVGEITEDEEGRDHVNFQQIHQGIPVYGAGAIIDLKWENVSSISARLLPSFSLNTTPALSVSDVQMIISEEHPTLISENTSLVIFNEGLLTNQKAETRLAWLVEVANPHRTEAYEYVINAHTGSILYVIDLIATTE